MTIHAYFNYPNSRVVVHQDPTCASIGQHHKVGQRHVNVDRASLSEALQRIQARDYRFAAEASSNDLWLTIDLADTDLEISVVKHVHRQFSKHYKRFADAVFQVHCEV